MLGVKGVIVIEAVLAGNLCLYHFSSRSSKVDVLSECVSEEIQTVTCSPASSLWELIYPEMDRIAVLIYSYGWLFWVLTQDSAHIANLVRRRLCKNWFLKLRDGSDKPWCAGLVSEVLLDWCEGGHWNPGADQTTGLKPLRGTWTWF